MVGGVDATAGLQKTSLGQKRQKPFFEGKNLVPRGTGYVCLDKADTVIDGYHLLGQTRKIGKPFQNHARSKSKHSASEPGSLARSTSSSSWLTAAPSPAFIARLFKVIEPRATCTQA